MPNLSKLLEIFGVILFDSSTVQAEKLEQKSK
jgi:hypothetical protein